jgi:uncharacterized protein YlxP (DUF503 family)
MSHQKYPHLRSVDHSFHFGVLQLDIRLPGCSSLKDKRGRLARLLNPIRKKYPVVIAEVGDKDIWGRCGLAAVTLNCDINLVSRILDQVADEMTGRPDVELVWQETELI